MVRIPSEYQEVEWIESTGEQRIITDLIPQFLANDEFFMRFAMVDTRKTQIFYGVAYNDNIDNRTYYNTLQGVCMAGGAFRPADTCISYSGQAHFNNGEWIDYQINEQTLTCKDVTGLTKDFSSNTETKLCLFCKYPESSTISLMRLSSVYYKRDGEYLLNLIPCYRKSDDEIGMYDTVTGTFYTNQGTGTFLKGNDVTYDPISLLETRRRILLNTPHIESVSGSIATFKTDLSANLTDMKIHFHPVQAGSGDPSPDNVRPITGLDGIEVSIAQFYRKWEDTGNNSEWSVGYFLSNGAISNLEGYMYTPDYIDVSNVDSLEFNFTNNTTSSYWYRIIEYDENKTRINASSAYANHRTYIPNDNAKYIRISCNTSSVVTLCSPNPATFPITFPKTIYGGYVDLVKGEVVEEYGTEVLNGSEVWGTQAENDTYYIKFLHSLSGGVVTGALNSGGLSNYIKTATSNEELKKAGNLCCRFGWSDRSLYILNAPIGLNGVTDLTSFKSYLSENNLVVVYPLATPNTYQLTPKTLKALKGINNIWSDANGNIEVKFWRH